MGQVLPNNNATIGDLIERAKMDIITGGKEVKIFKFINKEGINYGNLYDGNNPY